MRYDENRDQDRQRGRGGRNDRERGREAWRGGGFSSDDEDQRGREFGGFGIDDERRRYDRDEYQGRGYNDHRYVRGDTSGASLYGPDYGDRNEHERQGYGSQYRERRGHEGGAWESFKENVKDFFGVGPEGYRRSDERIREEASEALMRDPFVDASKIRVEVKDGIVTLRGSVESRWMKRQAEDCVDDISGVDDVRNELTVRKEKEQQNTQSSQSSMSNDEESEITRP